jgi:hypothetical protein
MKLQDALLCPDCDFIFTRNYMLECPLCNNKNTLQLGVVLNRATIVERRGDEKEGCGEAIATV